MKYIIYKITNRVNHKLYIGKTRRTIDIRLKEHLGCKGECLALIGAIKKYGKEKFFIERVDEANSWEESKLLETKYIIDLKTLVPQGYNLSLECPSGAIVHKRTIEKMVKKLQGNQHTKKAPNYMGVRPRGVSFEVRVKKNNICYRRSFSNELEAAEAYDKVILFLYGEHAKLNFIENLEVYLKLDLKEFFVFFCKKRELTSKYKGVSFHKGSKKWVAVIHKNGKTLHIGLFNNEIDAAKQRDIEHYKLYSNVDKLNFKDSI